MNSKAYKANVLKLTMLAVMMIVVTLAFLFVGVKFHNEKLLRYAMKLRIPKVLAMIIVYTYTYVSCICAWFRECYIY